jgi:hypothetical protein
MNNNTNLNEFTPLARYNRNSQGNTVTLTMDQVMEMFGRAVQTVDTKTDLDKVLEAAGKEADKLPQEQRKEFLCNTLSSRNEELKTKVAPYAARIAEAQSDIAQMEQGKFTYSRLELNNMLRKIENEHEQIYDKENSLFSFGNTKRHTSKFINECEETCNHRIRYKELYKRKEDALIQNITEKKSECNLI